MAGLTRAWADARPEVSVEIVLWDEMIDATITADVIASIVERAAADGARVVFGLTGVQTNQYPRARDLALQAKWAGLTVVFGGFHVSSHAPSRDFLTANGIAELRRERSDLGCIIQVDIESAADATPPDARENAAHPRSRRFVDLAAAAGCFEVFMGFESFSPANLEHTLKFHNQAPEDRHRSFADSAEVRERVRERYRRVVDNWHGAGVGVHAGYMIGLPFDEAGCGRRAAGGLAEIGVDIASFFAYTPLPGTEDYDRAVEAAAIVDSDFNSFDSHHFVSSHPRLTLPELKREYRDAYRHFYTWHRLAWSVSTGHRMTGLGWNARIGMLTQQIYFTYASRRGRHPMMGGIWEIRDAAGKREVVTDEEAADRYLSRSLPSPSTPPPAPSCSRAN